MKKLLTILLSIVLLCGMVPTGIAPVAAETERPTIKILSIGHSFSIDAMKTYMWDLFDAAGYDATIAYLYYPGASLERQYHYVKDNSKTYEIYAKNTNGTWVTRYQVCATDALWDEDWDIVTFQPSPDYGKGTMTYKCQLGCNQNINDYTHFGELVSLVRSRLRSLDNPCGSNTDVKLYYHLTWAFATDCKLWSFIYSNFDQMTMYQDFINATKTYVITDTRIEGVIPCITSIQNARTSFMGDTFNEPGGNINADGYHLNDKGDLVAALTWVSYFTGKSAANIRIDSKYSDHEYAAMAEAVDNAIVTPWSVTVSTYGEGMEDHVYDDAYDDTCNTCGAWREIVTITYGDLNGDGRINNRDLGLLQQYLAGWDVTVNVAACDLNGDDRMNNRDLGLLQQYLAGWDINLG